MLSKRAELVILILGGVYFIIGAQLLIPIVTSENPDRRLVIAYLVPLGLLAAYFMFIKESINLLNVYRIYKFSENPSKSYRLSKKFHYKRPKSVFTYMYTFMCCYLKKEDEFLKMFNEIEEHRRRKLRFLHEYILTLTRYYRCFSNFLDGNEYIKELESLIERDDKRYYSMYKFQETRVYGLVIINYANKNNDNLKILENDLNLKESAKKTKNFIYKELIEKIFINN